jgi:hypothetical protein
MIYLPASPPVTVNGERLSARVHALILDAAQAAGIDPADVVVIQGSRSSAEASGGTHAGEGAFDLRTWNLPQHLLVRFVVELRKRNVCAWLRTPAYGWPASAGGPHIHGLVRDEAGLSAPALRQIALYDRGLNGLVSNAKDPFPRPTQHSFYLSRWTAVIAPKTGVYAAPDRASKRVGSKAFGSALEYVGVETVAGEKWLRTRAGNFVLAARTAARWGK